MSWEHKTVVYETLRLQNAQHCLITHTDGALLLCFLPPSLRYLCYDSAPRAEPLWPECVFRAKIATDSGRNLPPIPGEGCH